MGKRNGILFDDLYSRIFNIRLQQLVTVNKDRTFLLESRTFNISHSINSASFFCLPTSSSGGNLLILNIATRTFPTQGIDPSSPHLALIFSLAQLDHTILQVVKFALAIGIPLARASEMLIYSCNQVWINTMNESNRIMRSYSNEGQICRLRIFE